MKNSLGIKLHTYVYFTTLPNGIHFTWKRASGRACAGSATHWFWTRLGIWIYKAERYIIISIKPSHSVISSKRSTNTEHAMLHSVWSGGRNGDWKIAHINQSWLPSPWTNTHLYTIRFNIRQTFSTACRLFTSKIKLRSTIVFQKVP